MKRFLRAFAAGALLGAILRRLAVHAGVQGLNTGLFAPDEAIDPALGVFTGYLLDYLHRKGKISDRQLKALAIGAIGARIAYEVLEAHFGQGILPISRPTHVGSVKDVVAYAASLVTYLKESKFEPHLSSERYMRFTKAPHVGR